ncbi:hypothetical protein [Clostridium saccharoperbutylacetonicum]|uniref:hypothetical protein n=1 Tax=Clostridium saccharoperbutylacetonicum TaxID=36745 RepID=UPI0039E9E88F
MKIYYVVGLAAYVASYMIFYFIYTKLNLEELLIGRTSRRIALFMIAIIFGIRGYSITDNLNIAKEYQLLVNSLFVGPSSALIVYVLPVKSNL